MERITSHNRIRPLSSFLIKAKHLVMAEEDAPIVGEGCFRSVLGEGAAFVVDEEYEMVRLSNVIKTKTNKEKKRIDEEHI